MANAFASGKNAIAECDRCGFQYKLKELQTLIVKARKINLLVCPQCWEPDQPQLLLGMYPINDPQALRNPRPDTTYTVAGTNADGNPSGGSRIFQWGWAPVGGSRAQDAQLTPNNLALSITLGTVSVSVT